MPPSAVALGTEMYSPFEYSYWYKNTLYLSALRSQLQQQYAVTSRTVAVLVFIFYHKQCEVVYSRPSLVHQMLLQQRLSWNLVCMHHRVYAYTQSSELAPPLLTSRSSVIARSISYLVDLY